MLTCKSINHHERIICDRLSFNKGEHWHILGPNGSGKSTLLHLLACIDSPQQGQVVIRSQFFDEHDLRCLAGFRCFLQQNYHMAFSLKVSELLTFYSESIFQNLPAHQEDLDKLSLLEDTLNIIPLREKQYNELSGGEQQRVQIYRCLSRIWPAIEQGEGLIILDEPLASLDVRYQKNCLNLLSQITELGNIVVMSSHDINSVASHASHVLMLKEGTVFASGKQNEVMDASRLTDLFEYPFVEFKQENKAKNIFICK